MTFLIYFCPRALFGFLLLGLFSVDSPVLRSLESETSGSQNARIPPQLGAGKPDCPVRMFEGPPLGLPESRAKQHIADVRQTASDNDQLGVEYVYEIGEADPHIITGAGNEFPGQAIP